MTSTATVRLGQDAFEWREWDPRPLGEATEWTHPGLVVTPAGEVIVFDQTTRELVRLDRQGRQTQRNRIDAVCAHGLTASGTDVWVADTGERVQVRDGQVRRDEAAGAVIRVDVEGKTTMALPVSEHPQYRSGRCVPTGVAVSEASGEVWVADGYGQSLVHRFSAGGERLATLDGTEGAGRFDCPHDVAIDARGTQPRLLITDRVNHRVAAYDLEGRFSETVGLADLRMPSAFTVAGDLLFVAELWSRVAVFDPDDRLMGYLGEGEVAWEEEAWPNRLTDTGVVRRAVTQGRFNAPHGMDAGPDGTLYLAEWSLGGRIVELAPSGANGLG